MYQQKILSTPALHPAGAGKTAIAEAAAAATLARGQRVIYTTPLKALSNQKLYEARKRFGVSRAGLQTGDTSLNTEADIVIMTTEILRNIMYRTAEIQGDGSSEWRMLLCVLSWLGMWIGWHCDALLCGTTVMPRVLPWVLGEARPSASMQALSEVGRTRCELQQLGLHWPLVAQCWQIHSCCAMQPASGRKLLRPAALHAPLQAAPPRVRSG
jgi:hypothetical protein